MKKKIFTIYFIVLMAAMGGISIATFVTKHCPETFQGDKKSTNVPVIESFEELYPFEKEERELPGTKKISIPWFLSKYLKKVLHAEAGIDLYTKEMNPLYEPFMSIPGWYNEATKNDIIINGSSVIVRLSNGYYTFPFPYSRSEKSWNNLLDFTKWLKPMGIKFFHMISADKGDDSFGTFPEGIPQGYECLAEEYKAYLDENGIDYLMAKPKLLAQNSDFYYWFYKADHHWNVHAGLQMAKESAKKIKELGFEADIDALKRENFTLSIYPNSFIGSLGRAMEPEYIEDMEVYFPINDTKFHIQIPSQGLDLRGNFNETLIVNEYLSMDNSSYCAFLHGDKPLIMIENEKVSNETRLLVIKQSKADIMCPYLANTIRYLDVIDPRCFNGSIRSFIEQTRPDVVMVCIDVPWEGGEKSWELK